jgi:hypothetical protein
MTMPKEIKEATEVALDTYNNIDFKNKSEADALLFKFLGQLLTTLQTTTKKLDGDTT